MLKDLRRRKEIIAKATGIAAEIMQRYSPEMDADRPGESKAQRKKKAPETGQGAQFRPKLDPQHRR